MTETATATEAQPTTDRPAGKPVLVCTEYKGVFFGFTEDSSGDTIKLANCRMAIYWGTKRGVQQLAATGPTESSKVGAACGAEIRKVTAVFDVTEEATAKWLQA